MNNELFGLLVALGGLLQIFTPQGLPLLGLVSVLTFLTYRTKKRIFSFLGMVLTPIFFITGYFLIVYFPVGPILGTILASEDHSMMIVFVMSSMVIPLAITITGLLLTKRRRWVNE